MKNGLHRNAKIDLYVIVREYSLTHGTKKFHILAMVTLDCDLYGK